ncbi:helix-turn-helix transcriptional regulator [Cohnella fermenti]|uniref:Helix-turn-helix domain-containing protein n=1 Tax=Cohnella fermenti TaxID=2565925 RepID=A0A4S4BI36_9BACL|nr:AraC family transcriptional regulator [Cohnella fermenti]THF74144.1 helix-turn-helix domain-containing protein [Cohnella fermenti]
MEEAAGRVGLPCVADEVTNRMLAERPVHCELRTAPLGQKTLHAHDGFEIYGLLRGTGAYIAGDRLYPLHAGTITVIRPQVIHRPYSSDGREFHRYVLSLSEAYMAGIDALCPGVPGGIGSLLTEPGCGSSHFFLSVPQMAKAQGLLGDMERALKADAARCGELSALRSVAELLLMLADLQGQPRAAGAERSENERLLGDVLAYLVAHYQEDLHIESLLRQFPISRSRLFGMFKAHTGVTINQFLTEYRIERAKALLAGTSLPVTEVAQRSGFNDLSHFHRIFRRQAGNTPLQYRSRTAGRETSAF